jgi:hypothetical protein
VRRSGAGLLQETFEAVQSPRSLHPFARSQNVTLVSLRF